jgi:hypothetical protein
LGDLDAEVNINIALETVRENKNWFDEGFSELSNQRQQQRCSCYWHPSKINRDILVNIKRATSRHIKKKKKEYLIEKTNNFATRSKN